MINKKGEGLGTFGNIITGGVIIILLYFAVTYGFTLSSLPTVFWAIAILVLLFIIFKK